MASSLLLLLATVTASLTPSTETVRLAWARSADAGTCPDARWAAREVTERLGRDPFHEQSGRAIEAVLAREHGRWHATIHVFGPGGQLLGVRRFVSTEPACEAVARAAALAVVLIIDPYARLTPPTTAPAPPPPPPPPAPVIVAPAAPAAPRPAWRSARVRAVAVGSASLLPETNVGAGLAASGPLGPSLRWQLGAMFLPAARTADFALGLMTFTPGLCWEPLRRDRLAVSACAALHVGEVLPVVFELPPVEPGHRLWLGGAAGVRLDVSVVGPLRATAGADVVVPITRDRFYVEGKPDSVYRQPPAGLLFLGGLGLNIP